MQLLRKISRATVIGNNEAVMEKCLAEKNKAHPLYNVYGYATGTRSSKDDDNAMAQFGPWECLIGSFEAVNLLTGEVFRSGQCFLPQFAIDMVAGQLGGDVERVKFAFRVGAHYADTPTKYEYTVDPLLEVTEDDPLKSISAEIQKPAQIEDKKASKK